MQPSLDLEKLQRRAYEIWLADGMKHGRDLEYWCAAEREFLSVRQNVAPAKTKKGRARAAAPQAA